MTIGMESLLKILFPMRREVALTVQICNTIRCSDGVVEGGLGMDGSDGFQRCFPTNVTAVFDLSMFFRHKGDGGVWADDR